MLSIKFIVDSGCYHLIMMYFLYSVLSLSILVKMQVSALDKAHNRRLAAGLTCGWLYNIEHKHPAGFTVYCLRANRLADQHSITCSQFHRDLTISHQHREPLKNSTEMGFH